MGKKKEKKSDNVLATVEPQKERTTKNTVSTQKDVLTPGEKDLKDFLAVDIDRTDEKYIKVGKKFSKSLIVNGFPSTINVGWLDSVYSFDGDIDCMLHVIPSDERSAIDQLTAKITQFEAQLDIESKKGNIRNITSLQDKISSLVEQRRMLEQNVENLYYIQIIINVFAETKDILDKQIQKLISSLKSKRVNVDEMYLRQEEAFRSALPVGVTTINDKFRNFNTGALCACFPFYNSEISHQNGVFIGLNMSTATPMFIDFYDRTELNNSNASVFGQAGSGKTFFVSLLTLRSAIKGIKTVIIDPEGEYEKISHIVGGSSIKLSTDAKDGINPLDIEEDQEGVTENAVDLKSKVSDILNLVAVMVGGLSNEAKAMVSHAISQTYKKFGITSDSGSLYNEGSFYDEETDELLMRQKKAMPTLSDLKYSLEQLADSSDMNKNVLLPVINTLSMFCKGGIYDMFDRQTSPHLKNYFNAPIVNFDISNLEESILRPIGMYVAMSWTWEKFIKKNPDTKKRILCDEAWMLVNKNMAGYEFTSQFLENCARRIRKRNGGLIVASQNFSEFAEISQGRAVLSNAVVNIFLKQNSTDIDALQDTFKISEGEKNFLLLAKKGEMLMKINDESAIAYAYPFAYEKDIITASKASKDT